MVVFTGPDSLVASNFFDEGLDGWFISGNNIPRTEQNKDDIDIAPLGLRHKPVYLGNLSGYVYGVDEVQFLNYTYDTIFDQTKWYFEASHTFYRPELLASYGGFLRFRIRALYGNFSELNSPLDWVTLECAVCDGGRGTKLVRYIDDTLKWDGSERYVEMRLHPSECWRRHPLNVAFWSSEKFADECEIAGVLTGLSRLAILGDWTKGGEGIAIDDVTI